MKRLTNQIIVNFPGIAFWKDTEGKFTDCNDAFARFVGLTSRQEVIGKTAAELPWEKDAAERCTEQDIEILSQKRPIASTKIQVRSESLGPAILSINKTPIFNEAGEILGIMGTYTLVEEADTDPASTGKSDVLQQIHDLAEQLDRELCLPHQKDILADIQQLCRPHLPAPKQAENTHGQWLSAFRAPGSNRRH